MSVFTSLGILILAMLILLSLKLIPGIFMLFTHFNLGKFSRKKAEDLSIFFIFGVETMFALIFIFINSVFYLLSSTEIIFENAIFNFIFAGIMLALCLATFLFYFKKGSGTKLFISRKTAHNFIQKAKTAKNRSDAFLLGFIAGIPELLFTLPLFTVSYIEISKLSFPYLSFSALILVFILISVIPLFIIYVLESTNHNLAELEKSRIKNKTFFRVFISTLYLLLAILIIIPGVTS